MSIIEKQLGKMKRQVKENARRESVIILASTCNDFIVYLVYSDAYVNQLNCLFYSCSLILVISNFVNRPTDHFEVVKIIVLYSLRIWEL